MKGFRPLLQAIEQVVVNIPQARFILAGPWQMFSDRNRTRSVAWYLLHPRAYVGAELWGQKFVWRMEAFWRLCTGYVGIVALVLAAALAMLGVPFRST